MKTTAPVYQQHREHVLWKNNLVFYKEEIAVFSRRLEELATKNNKAEVNVKIEHFQNQFIIQRNTIDELIHRIHVCEDELETNIKKNPVATEHKKVEFHADEQEQINMFEEHFNKLRKEFYVFAAQWM